MRDVTRRQRREADSDFHSSARLIRRRDIARYSGSTTARLCIIQCDFYRQLAMQHSESSTAAHLCVNFNATRCSGMCCRDAQISARFLFGDIVHSVRSNESHYFIR